MRFVDCEDGCLWFAKMLDLLVECASYSISLVRKASMFTCVG